MASQFSPAFARTVAALAAPPRLAGQPLLVLHVVLAMRLRPLFERAGRDPVSELATRFASVPAALAVLDLVDTVARSWPEAVVVHRPCCRMMSPDEATVAALVRHAAAGNRAASALVLAGFVEPGHHGAVYEAVRSAVAALASANAA